MKHIREAYRAAYRENGDSPKSVLWPKGRQDLRFKALTNHIAKDTRVSILDFGCGLAHLRDYLHQQSFAFSYTGADIVPEFIEANRAKFPDDRFLLIKDASDIKDSFDHVVISGTFNMLYFEEREKHRDYIFDALAHLFDKTHHCLSVNFMTDQVDFVQGGAYHQNMAELHNFVSGKLSRRLLIDQSYMPYEYSITIWKDASIIRPDNVYRNA